MQSCLQSWVDPTSTALRRQLLTVTKLMQRLGRAVGSYKDTNRDQAAGVVALQVG